MKATMTEFNDNGETIKKQIIAYFITWGEKFPTIYIDLPDRTKTRHQSVEILLKQFLYFFKKQKNSKRIKEMRKGLNPKKRKKK